MQRLYAFFGVKTDATEGEIKKAYRKLISIWHPDRYPNNSNMQQQAEEKSKEINNAYDEIEKHRKENKNTVNRDYVYRQSYYVYRQSYDEYLEKNTYAIQCFMDRYAYLLVESLLYTRPNFGVAYIMHIITSYHDYNGLISALIINLFKLVYNDVSVAQSFACRRVEIINNEANGIFYPRQELSHLVTLYGVNTGYKLSSKTIDSFIGLEKRFLNSDKRLITETFEYIRLMIAQSDMSVLHKSLVIFHLMFYVLYQKLQELIDELLDTGWSPAVVTQYDMQTCKDIKEAYKHLMKGLERAKQATHEDNNLQATELVMTRYGKVEKIRIGDLDRLAKTGYILHVI
ncbi:MAG: DnaJ domain-containing protein [Nitrospirae bacterium]|nr:DnaJ domain-containing protein [Nitrospirota bacterium]